MCGVTCDAILKKYGVINIITNLNWHGRGESDCLIKT